MDIIKSNIAIGIGAAVAATMFAPVILPVVASVGRPVAKSLLRAGMLFYEKSREAVAIGGEAMEDLIAEIHAEEATRRAAFAAARGTGAPAPAGHAGKAGEATGDTGRAPGMPAHDGAGAAPAGSAGGNGGATP